jgi:microcystin-dependent protein
MGTPFMGELRIMAFNYAPKGWAQCNGQLMPINQNQALFSLLGTTYGGNGQTNYPTPGPTLSVAQGHSTATGQPAVDIFGTAAPNRTFAASAITNTGGSQAHSNTQPYLCLNICIALQGIFPTPN